MANKIDDATVGNELQETITNWNGFVREPSVQMLKQIKYKVSLKKLFKPNELKKFCKLERKRMKKISYRLSFMFAIGMPLPSANAIFVKVGLLSCHKFVVKKHIDDDKDDEIWKPSKPRATKSLLLSTTEYSKHQKFVFMKFMVSADGGDTEVKKCKEDMSKLMSPWPRLMLQKLDVSGYKPKNEKSQTVKATKKEDEKIHHYSTRGIQWNYTEPDDPDKLEAPDKLEPLDDDHYLYCDICEKFYEGDCPAHGPYTKVPNTLVKWGLPDRARQTCPNGISVAPSKIRFGGLGAWADQDFSQDSVFGPYEGVDMYRDDMKKWKLIFDDGYAWEIYKNGKLSHYIDGSNLKESNWLRYVNCARNEEEQNVVAYQYKGEIYYRAYKDIKKGMELLVWYGQQYAEELGITAQKIAAQSTTPLFEIPGRCYECEKCDRIFADEEAIRRHMKVKHPDRNVVKRFKCELCSYSTDDRPHFKRHLRVHTKEKPYQCTVCSKRFTISSNLKSHIRIHTKECPYECDKCGKKFNRLSNMQTHIRTVHDKCKSFVCNVCGLTFGRAMNLTKHMLTHTGVRLYNCQYCDRRFPQYCNLQRHERIHTGEKPHQCKECSAAFIQPSGLRDHVIVCHSKKYPYRCSICDKGFLIPSQMKRHESQCKSLNTSH